MDELDSFLKDGTRPDGAQMPAEPPAERAALSDQPAESKPAPGSKRGAPEPASRESGGKQPESEPEDDGEALNARDGEALVPRRAYEDERRKRQDWKSKAAAADATAEELRRQLEEAKRPPPPPAAQPPQMQMPPQPDPQVDPIGYMRWELWQQQQAMLNDRLNLSEEMVREKIGKEKLDEYVSDFKAFAAKDETLFKKLHQQPAPYQWLVREVDRYRAQAEIGDDPSAFEQKLRAKIMAEMAEQAAANGNGHAMPTSNLPRQPPSLATARSVAGRSAIAWTGPPAMDDILRRPERRAR